jgi:hypothetical protein
LSRAVPHDGKPTGVISRAAVRLGLLLLAALILGVLPAIAGEHHAPAYGDKAGVEHVHVTDLEPCAQDQAANGECAAIGNCPVGALRDYPNVRAHPPEPPVLPFPALSAMLGRSIMPEIQPPRRTVFI